MLESLKPLLQIQELDMKMLRLMRIKRERQKELKQIEDLRKDLHDQVKEKEVEVTKLGSDISLLEEKTTTFATKLKALEDRQGQIKKLEEFNALTQEMTSTERERVATEQKISDLTDRKTLEEELLHKIKESLDHSEVNSIALEKEIEASIVLINEEGSLLKAERDAIATMSDVDLLRIYERLLRNKKDRVIVAVENRACSGCHIALTAQHENSVRKGENIIFCEHCSRLHYWPEVVEVEGAADVTKRRRRRVAST